MNKLTALAAKKTQPQDRTFKMSDGGGLFLVVEPKGRKWWRLRYHLDNKERALSLGVFPRVSLAEARRKRDEIKRQIAEGKDPATERKRGSGQGASNGGPTLAMAAGEWLARQDWTSNYREKVEGRLRRHVFPQLGDQAVAEITPPELLKALQRIEEAGTIETARRCKQHVSRIYKFAIATGTAQSNPAQGLEEAMVAKPKPKHFAAITNPDELGQALRAMYGLKHGTPHVQAALKLLPLLMLRPGELLNMEWSEWAHKDRWEISAEKMKMGSPHIIPLPWQAITILSGLKAWSGGSRYVFPNIRTKDRHMPVETLTAAIRRLGYTGDQLTAHGFRATARTLLDEELKYRPDYIEHQLAHAVRDPNGRAYNRTAHLEERRGMMQAWADYLDALRGPELPVAEEIAKPSPMAEAFAKGAEQSSRGMKTPEPEGLPPAPTAGPGAISRAIESHREGQSRPKPEEPAPQTQPAGPDPKTGPGPIEQILPQDRGWRARRRNRKDT